MIKLCPIIGKNVENSGWKMSKLDESNILNKI